MKPSLSEILDSTRYQDFFPPTPDGCAFFLRTVSCADILSVRLWDPVIPNSDTLLQFSPN